MTIPGFDDVGAVPHERPAVLEIGLHRNVSPAWYHADPCAKPSLSSSIANTILSRSEAHARLEHPRLGGGRRDDATVEMDRGTLLHRLILGQGANVEAIEPKNKKGEPSFSWATAEAKAAREAAKAAGRIPVLAWKLREAELAAEVISANLFAVGIDISAGEREVVAVWEERADDGSAVLCRCMLDYLDDRMVMDLKIPESAHPETCTKQIGNMGYAVQIAAYVSAIERLFPERAGRVGHLITWAEPEAPYCVTPVELSCAFLEYGQRRWRRAVNRWAKCLKTGVWPGYTSGIIRGVEPPPWLLTQDSEGTYVDGL